MDRLVEPELLDELPFDDPEAQRSRRELCMINRLMGNFRWLRKRLAAHPERALVELGAGSGDLLNSLANEDRRMCGVDLAPRPADLADAIAWHQGDVRDVLAEAVGPGCVAVANHFLHQFEDEDLRRLGEAMNVAEVLLACEPLRSRRARWGIRALGLVVNRVTLHDGLISVRAGFRRGELPGLLGLDEAEWDTREEHSVLGAYRLSARRRRS